MDSFCNFLFAIPGDPAGTGPENAGSQRSVSREDFGMGFREGEGVSACGGRSGGQRKSLE